MDNVAKLSDRRIDVREHQAMLIEAESASLAALEKASNASAAFVRFVQDMKLSVVHPRVRKMLRRIPVTFQKAVDVSDELSEFHNDAQRLLKSHGGEVIMTGGIPKEELPPEEAERRVF